MKIVYVAPFGLRKKTTVWARTLPMARQAVRHGATATVLVPPWDCPEDAGKRWQVDGVEIIHTGLGGRLPGIAAQLLARVNRLRPDVVHIVKPRAYAGIVQWLLWAQAQARTRPGPAVLLDIDDWEQAWTRLSGFRPPLSTFLNWQERWGIAHAQGITAASQWLMQKVEQLAPGTPALYLPNGISPGAGQPQAKIFDAQRPPTVLLFSRFVEVEPGWLGAFWQAARQETPHLHLLVAGQALPPGREAAFAQALGSDENVTWLGFVQPETLADLYRRVDCAIFPAQATPLNLAKCSVRLATTLLHGVPVVASAVGEQANYGREGAARLVPAQASPAEFARAVCAVVSQPVAQQALAAQARQNLLARYDWSRLGRSLMDFYAELSASATGRLT